MNSMIRKAAKSIYQVVTNLPNRFTIASGRLGMIELYQPIYGDNKSKGQRVCSDRWNVIKQYLPKQQFSFMDIGSQIGYFTFHAANAGAVSLGVERSKRYCEFAQAIKCIRKIDHVAFLNMDIDSHTVKGLPNVDVMCCMSIFHHWVREYDFEKADYIFNELCNRTKILFFDTGQVDERNTDWAGTLEFMNPEPVVWIENYLRAKGFKTVKQLGVFPTHLSDVPRMLFYAAKN